MPGAVTKPAASQPVDPFAQVLADMEQLMRENNELGAELSECRERAESDRKRLLLSMIEVADAFENVLDNIKPRLEKADPQARKWVGNFNAVYDRMQRVLNSNHLTPIEVIPGEKANPFWHNIVETATEPGAENGTIAEIIKKGYLLDGKMLRPVEVKAVKNG